MVRLHALAPYNPTVPRAGPAAGLVAHGIPEEHP